MKNKIQIILLILFTPFISFSSESPLLFETGIFGGYNHNIHSTNFQSLPGYKDCCPQYDGGTGNGINIGLFGNFPINESIKIGLALDYSTLDGDIVTEETQTFDNSEGSYSNGVIEHRISTNISSFNLQPRVTYNFYDNWNLFAGIGLRLLSEGEFQQHEKILQPNDVTFKKTGTIIRNERSGKIPDQSSFLPNLSVGVNYTFPLLDDNSFSAAPFINYKHNFGNFINSSDWAISTITAGFQIAYNIFEKRVPIETKPPEKPDTNIIVEKPKESNFEGDFYYSLNEEFQNDTININYNKGLKFEAILGYVFFEENNSEIPDRYNLLSPKEKENFNPKELSFEESLSGYYNVLNILGQRFQKFPDVEIDLVGCNSDHGEEERNLELSKSRAETVKDYFVEVWNLNPERFNIKSRNLPEIPASSDNEYGREENRRVEIIPQDWTIFRPQLISDEFNTISENFEVTLTPDVKSEIPINNWKMVAYNNSRFVKEFTGKGPPEELVWKPADDNISIPTKHNPLRFKLIVEDNNGVSKSFTAINKDKKEGSNNVGFVQKFNTDTKTERYNLILFGYNVKELPEAVQPTINLIREKIKDKSKVKSIEGYSDIIGDDKYNMQLSKERAVTVAKTLNVSTSKAVGRGKVKNEIYDNSLPEGRFYSRSVIITLDEE